ncbi:MAG: hypothetical protein R3A78_02790 [Polyangiales bacterium]|nr:hypothetical protein [Myxococcales bacterium]
MTQRILQVLTKYPDIASLAEAFRERVGDGSLMLYGATPVDEGEEIRFEVLLGDQSVALAGVGRSVGSFEGGAERSPDEKFDIVLDSLELDGTSSIVYDRILMVRDGAATGEVSIGELEEAGDGGFDDSYEHQPTRIAPPDADIDVDFAEEQPTMVAQLPSTPPAAVASEDIEMPWSSSAPPARAASEPPAAETWGGLEPVASEPPPASLRPASMPPASVPPASVPPASVRPGSMPPASVPPAWDAAADGMDSPSMNSQIPAAPEAPDWDDDDVPGTAVETSMEVESYSYEAEELSVSDAMEEMPETRVSSMPPARRASSMPPAPASWEQEFAARAADGDGAEPESAPVPGAPSEPSPFPVQSLASTGSILTRPSAGRGWDSSALLEQHEPRPVGQYFAYAEGQLPVPASPPVPEGAAAGSAPPELIPVEDDEDDFRGDPQAHGHASFGEQDETDFLEEDGNG